MRIVAKEDEENIDGFGDDSWPLLSPAVVGKCVVEKEMEVAVIGVDVIAVVVLVNFVDGGGPVVLLVISGPLVATPVVLALFKLDIGDVDCWENVMGVAVVAVRTGADDVDSMISPLLSKDMDEWNVVIEVYVMVVLVSKIVEA